MIYPMDVTTVVGIIKSEGLIMDTDNIIFYFVVLGVFVTLTLMTVNV